MMKYWEMFKEENEAVKERHELALERIGQFKTEETVAEPYRSYFRKAAEFIMLAEKVYGMQERGELEALSLDEAKKLNIKLYEDVLPGNYEESFCNPAFAVAALGRDFGQYLAFLLTEIRGMIVYAYESRLTDMTILEEVLIEVYNLFESEEPELKEVKEVLYYFVSDYCDVMLTYRVRETLDPSLDFAKSIIMDSDLTDLRYLYRFGEYISDSELKIAAFLNSLPEETVRKMADTYTEGIRKGFVASGRSYKSKKTVQIRYHIGFERMIRMAVENFRKLGLEPVISRAAVGTVNRAAARTNGYHGTPANRQYDYDHRYDNAIYMDKAFKERKLSVLKVAYEECRTLAKAYAGPAVLETFGEEGFTPENKKEAFALSEKQEKLLLSYSNESMQIADAYVPGMETSFTIIAFPLPEIGDNFEKIFEETIRINTLDYELYRDIQQCIIDALDQADHVMVYGMGENRTKLKVALRRLKNPAKETNFENCVADVNIPVGEVFTSPVLAGTNGTLHVSEVFLNGLQYLDLEVVFKDGMIESYNCGNFADEAQNKAYIRDNILMRHETLPMGEFAIGTNTTAYRMAKEYQIGAKLPILIAEKTGPHFAVGDTCYSHAEDTAVYNPNGKEIIARDNEKSLLRKEDMSKAYFNCHTDITIPYDELGAITVIRPDGSTADIIRDGLFQVEGAEELNEPLLK